MKTINDYVYASVETDFEDLSSEKDKILTYLKENRDKSITAPKIIKHLNLKSKKNDVALRKIIAELVNENKPIISDVRGYMYTEDLEKINKYLLHLQMRIDGIERRRNSLITTRIQIEAKNGK